MYQSFSGSERSAGVSIPAKGEAPSSLVHTLFAIAVVVVIDFEQSMNTVYQKLAKGIDLWLNLVGDHQLFIHKRALLNRIPTPLLFFLFCRRYRNRSPKPENLTILLVHNYPTKSILEKSLDYLGIQDYVVLRPTAPNEWVHTLKLQAILNYLREGKCQTEYVLYCDSDDIIVINELSKTIDLLHQNNCEMLVSTTDWEIGYECIPEVREWAVRAAAEAGYQHTRKIHMNTGVFIAKQTFLREFLEAATPYVTDQDLSVRVFKQLRDTGKLCDTLPEYPKGCGDDQVLMRYLQPQFHPRIKLDYDDRLAFR